MLATPLLGDSFLVGLKKMLGVCVTDRSSNLFDWLLNLKFVMVCMGVSF